MFAIGGANLDAVCGSSSERLRKNVHHLDLVSGVTLRSERDRILYLAAPGLGPKEIVAQVVRRHHSR